MKNIRKHNDVLSIQGIIKKLITKKEIQGKGSDRRGGAYPRISCG